MHHPFTATRLFIFGTALLLQQTSPLARATVVYHSLQGVAIPTDFAGVYLDLDSGATSSAEFTGWDINPFFGGVGVANSSAFQPARTDTSNQSSLVALGFGSLVGANLNFSGGEGGSSGHLGTGANHFGINQEAYIGFSFSTDANAGPYFGWMRVIFTANTPGGVIKDWAYETDGQPIEAGNVLQSAPVAGISAIALSGDAGQTSTLGPITNNLGNGVALAISKTGAGDWTISAPGNYASLNASAGTTHLGVDLAGASLDANGSSVVDIDSDETLSDLTIEDGAVVNLESGASASSFDLQSLANLATSVPEPGCAALIASGLALQLFRSRRLADQGRMRIRR